MLYIEPQRIKPLGRELAVVPLRVQVERDGLPGKPVQLLFQRSRSRENSPTLHPPSASGSITSLRIRPSTIW